MINWSSWPQITAVSTVCVSPFTDRSKTFSRSVTLIGVILLTTKPTWSLIQTSSRPAIWTPANIRELQLGRKKEKSWNIWFTSTDSSPGLKPLISKENAQSLHTHQRWVLRKPTGLITWIKLLCKERVRSVKNTLVYVANYALSGDSRRASKEPRGAG